MAKNPRPQAIVLDGNQRSSLAVTRSLGRAGVRVIVGDSSPRCLAASSRFAAESLLYPSPILARAGFEAWLRDLARIHPTSVLIPMTDDTVPVCLGIREALGSLRLPYPSLAAYESVSDKYELFLRARELGIDVPQTLLVVPARERHVTWPGAYPVVVKPRWSSALHHQGSIRQPVAYARSAEELASLVTRLYAEGAPALLLQEYVAGTGEGSFALYDKGRRLIGFAHRRLREKPPSGGVSVLSESVALDDKRASDLDRILAPWAWDGVAMAEYKVTPGGRAVLIEINARFWGSLQLAIDSGVDFPLMLYMLAIGETPNTPSSYRLGRRLRWLLGDLDYSYLLFRDQNRSRPFSERIRLIVGALAPWLPRTQVETFRLSDPGPFLRELRQYIAALS